MRASNDPATKKFLETDHGTNAGYASGCRCEYCVGYKRYLWRMSNATRLKKKGNTRAFTKHDDRIDVILEILHG